MRPLPRLIAVTTDAILEADDFPVRAAAIAAAGPGVAILVRGPGLTAARRLEVLDRVRRLAGPPEAAVLAHGDPALGRIGGAHGVQLRAGDLTVADARTVFGPGWLGRSVHETAEAEAARLAGADFLVAGAVFETGSHPGRTPRGLEWLAQVAMTGVPTFGIGGITADRVAAVKRTGAWGVAAISALWHADDPAAATDAMLMAWEDG